MKLLEIFDKSDVPDRYRFVFDEVNAETGSYRVLAMSEDGYKISEWRQGVYDPEGQNGHLGERTTLAALGACALDGFFFRLSIPDNWEEVYQTIEQMMRDDE
jgi:hypothetical protein